MINTKTVCTLFVLFVIFLISISSNARQVSSNFAYTYIQESNGIFTLNWIDPLAGVVIKSKDINVPSTNKLIDVKASPDGNYLMLFWQDEEWGITQIYNASTQVFQSLPDNFKTYLGSNSTTSTNIEMIPIWSPDSQYLAFNSVKASTNPVNSYIYSLQSNQIIAVYSGYDRIVPYKIKWNNISSQLAIAVASCEKGTDIICDSIIQVVDITSANVQAGVNLSFLPGEICELIWSPTDTKVLFQFPCTDLSEFYREVYVYDIAQEDVRRVTTYTNSIPASSDLNIFLNNRYSFTWIDESNFVISSVSALGPGEVYPETFSVQTGIYRSSTQHVSEITNDFRFNWLYNSEMDVWAYQKDIIVLDTDNYPSIQGRSVEISRFDGQNFTSTLNAPSGCILKWDPRNEFLGFRNSISLPNGTFNCSDSLTFSFVNYSASKVVSYTVNPAYAIYDAGWLLENDTVTPTESPIKTSSPVLSIIDMLY